MNVEQLISDASGGVFQFPVASAGIKTLRLPATMRQQIIDTNSVTDKASFLRAASAAMRFPDHFGHNWDAFYDCLSDSAEHFAQGLLVIFNDLSQFAHTHPEAFETAIDVMNDAVKYWEGSGKQLVILIGLNDPGLGVQLPSISLG